MKKDIKYIIKRIIIGVGIALTLGFLRANLVMDVNALTSVPITVSDTDASQVINSNTRSITFGGNWNVMSYFNGYIVGSFSIQKTNNNAVEPIVTPRYVLAMSSTARYTCEIGSTTANNSTYVSQTYTYKCPVSFGDVGLDGIVVGFNGQQLQSPSVFIVDFVNRLNFYTDEPNINFDTSGTTNAINNQILNDINNTQSIIDNNTSNMQSINNNNNNNTNKMIESQKVCTVYDKNSIVETAAYLNNNGQIITQSQAALWGITDYINIDINSTLKRLNSTGQSPSTCFYNINKSLIFCLNNNSGTSSDYDFTIPSDASFVRFSINFDLNRPQFQICRNGNQAISDSVNDLNNTINNDSVDTGQANGFFSNFTTNSHGLSGIITAPLRLLNSFTTATCSPLQFNLPFIHDQVTLPCMRGIYEDYFGVFFSLWQLITTGLISYNICINLYSKVRNLQNPNNDRIEVLNL